MNVDVVQTGSSGNFCVLDKHIAIDIGVPWKVVKPYSKKLKIVLLTHIHG